jgi:serine/threonine-protein kinase
MHIRCPHCQNPIELLPDEPDGSRVSCPSCGSALDFLRETVQIQPDQRTKVGRFELLAHVGRGQFGDVWKARDTELERTVAVKIPRTRGFDDATLQLFLREARAAAQVRHPHIVPVHEVGREDHTAFIVSDFVEGVTLKELIHHRRPGPGEAAQLCVTIADALQHAHDAGVVHRDLKPGNIMIDGQGQPYLMDFGLAKRDAGEITVTLDGQVLGTPAYMSPEQARGDGHTADRRSDIYSLGVILYEMLTGELPFRGGSTMLIHQILSHDPRPPRKVDAGLPRDLETICLKAMEKDPARRYQTARELALDLQRFLDGQSILARPVSRVERAWRWTRRNRAASVAIGTTLLSAVLLLVLLVFQGEAQSPPVERRKVVLETDPPGAQAVLVPVDEETWEPMPDRAISPAELTPLEIELEPALYLVVVRKRGHGFHEVYRTVPPRHPKQLPQLTPFRTWRELPDGRVTLPTIAILPTEQVLRNLVYLAGGDFTAGDDRWPMVSPVHSRTVEPFYLAPREVTVAEYRAFSDDLGAAFRRQANPPGDDHAMNNLSFAEALEYAESLGMRLPTEYEYEFAATQGGRSAFPWGDDRQQLAEWRFGPLDQATFDQTPTDPPISGLYSDVAEWTLSRYVLPQSDVSGFGSLPQLSNARVIRGGPFSVLERDPQPGEVEWGPRWRHAVDDERRYPGLGFRCARSAQPRYLNAGRP